ncbi:MAG: Uma2 family endonuclease [Chloroflexi bacterium CFX4]|nr:Uma2 family endonuclease [Chloroflexi bacterium CFX4]MDL1922784.1 Uma2 family endonuclease [Chloroflexi bacterium CFX3]
MLEQVQERHPDIDQLWAIAHAESDGVPNRYELDEGELVVMSPSGALHGILTVLIGRLVGNFVEEHDLGLTFGAETGFVLHQDNEAGRSIVRAPDFAFVSKARAVPVGGKFYPIAPDFAVEVVSPSDTARQMRRKARQYLQYGTRLLWIIFPDAPDRFVDVYRPNQPLLTVQGEQLLEGYDVLPDFNLPVSRLFARLDS